MYKNHKASQSGFTLVEIIVVIGIIGILSSIVYASFGQARKQSRDNAIKSEMEVLRLEARLYYEQFGEYSPNLQRDDSVNECSGHANMGDSMFGNGAQNQNIIELVTKIGSISDGAANRVYCAATPYEWAFAAPLYSPSGSNTGYCVDSSGVAKEISGNFNNTLSSGGPNLRFGSNVRCP